MAGSDWSDVRQRLAQLAAQPGAGEVFGSRLHRWELEPPLRPDELRDLEAQLRVDLPDEYRSFLLHVGRGGAGPAYGLFRLLHVDGRWQWDDGGADLTDLETLAQPFAHTEAFNPADELPARPDGDDYDSLEAFNEADDAYWELHDQVLYRREYSIGLLYLCHLGCALHEALVVSGPLRGRMWADYTADGRGFQPLVDSDGTPLGFARWYRRWLDQAEAKASQGVHA
jgi:hypothetical protein